MKRRLDTTRLRERGPFGPRRDATMPRRRRRGRTRVLTQVDAFLQSLIDFNGEDIAEDLVKRVQPYLDDPVFSYDKMKSKSAAAANLCAISAF